MNLLSRCGGVALATLAMWTAPAAALPVSGTFSGIARAEATPINPTPDHPVSFYDGATVKGWFNLNIPQDLSTETFFAEIHFDIRGERFSFLAGPDSRDHPGAISFGASQPGDPRQSLSFFTTWRPRFDGAIIDFYSDRGLMVQGEDFSTLNVGPDTVSSLGAYFADPRASIAVNVDVQAFALDGPAPPIDEPPLWLLLGVGVAAVGAWQRRIAGTRPA